MKFRFPRFIPIVAAAAAAHAQTPAPVPATVVPPGPSPAVPLVPAQPATSPPAAVPGTANADSVNIQFPRNSVFDVLMTYETLTGKRLIRDANLAGPEISIMVGQPVSRQEAIKLIESSLLLNGYSIVPVDDQTVKILGPSRAPRTEGLPLYIDSKALPKEGDRIVSFYKPLAFVSPEEAIAVLDQVVQRNAYGMFAPVPNTNAIIITDKTPVIQKSLGVLNLIDVEPAQVVTEFVPLQRANAERIVEILDEMFGKDDPSSKNGANAQAANPQGVPPGGQPGSPGAAGTAGARYENRLVTGKAKFVADKRTNRVLVVTRQENYRYVRDVITQLDAAGTFEQPFVRICNYVPVTEVFPVLTDMLAEADSEKKGGQAGAQPTPSNPFNNTNKSQNNSAPGSGTRSGATSKMENLLDEETTQSAPQSVTIGETKLIADNSSNSIIVFGPPESKERAKQILDLLDQRPKQVYLAVVIGELNVTNTTEYGVQYLIRYQGASGNGLAAAALNPLLFSNSGTNALPNPASLTRPAALAANGLGALSGLTVIGTIADSVDVYARFLESRGNFRTLSRPVIYTSNNRKATIFSGQRVPYPQSSLTTATGGGINNNGTAVSSSIAYEDVVLQLDVIPLINSDREVNLIIAQKNNTLGAEKNISGNLVNIINTQEIKTSVRVPNGSTIVLGGLITETKKKDQAGIPYISRIPVIGSLLGGRTSNAVDKNELVVMIQPVVVDTNAEMMKASAYEGDRTPLGQDAQFMTAPLAEQARPSAPWKPKPSPTPKPRRN